MGLSRSVSEINGDFSQKSKTFPPPYIERQAECVLLGIGLYWMASSN